MVVEFVIQANGTVRDVKVTTNQLTADLEKKLIKYFEKLAFRSRLRRGDRQSDPQLQTIALTRLLRPSAGKLAFLALAILLGLAAWLVLPRAIREQRFRAGFLWAAASCRSQIPRAARRNAARAGRAVPRSATDAAIADYLHGCLSFPEAGGAGRRTGRPARGRDVHHGRGPEPGQSFYQAATDYYSADSTSRTEHLSGTCDCLADVRD